jgi:hypothetical protein
MAGVPDGRLVTTNVLSHTSMSTMTAASAQERRDGRIN